MGDRFEKFIIDNRNSFDNESPSNELWGRIEKDIHPNKASFGLLWKVAAALFLISTIVLLIERLNEPVGPVFSPEFVQAEDYYVTLINQRKNILKERLNADQEKRFLQEINQLDSMYLELKKTYKINAASERVIDAMINNLRLRSDILNRQLEFLENIKNEKNENGDTIQM
ncbi:MAG: hypothetical protein GDA51_12925 [Ekhidna sp.]|nr:hypothetical protein [Ekhidna sp.]MBC6411165.1 hypothetical protein [Ekhidna sp.]MBC6427336.1 hypothetical protein [Ekhidna sp.]